ncbi:MAG TPA: hypothetical protein PKD68_01865 [Candidatus Saccharibacteria bacterium]|nr:hypothetical protein [Candidatus Saccharibacteria bacterium]
MSDFIYKWAASTVLATILATIIIAIFGGDIGNGWGVLALVGLAIIMLGFIAEQIILASGDFKRRRPLATTIISVTTVIMMILVVVGVAWLAQPIAETTWQLWLTIVLVLAVGAGHAAIGIFLGSKRHESE